MTTATKAKPAANSFENVAAQAKESYEGFVKAGQEQAAKAFEQTASATKEQVEKASAQFLKGYADFQAIAKANFDALVQSSAIAGRGAEDMSREVVAYAQSTFDKSVTTGKSLLTAKSLKEVVDLQSEYVKSSIESLVAETTRLQDLSSQVTKDAMAPLNDRVKATFETLSKPIAA